MHHYLAPQIYGEKSNRAELKEQGFTDALWKEPVTSVSVAIAYELRSTYGSWLNASDSKGIYESFGKARWAAEMRRQRGRRWEIFQRPCLVAESNRAIAALILLGDNRGSYLKNINYGKRISLGAIAACWDIPGADGTYVSIPSHQCDCGSDFWPEDDFCSLCGSSISTHQPEPITAKPLASWDSFYRDGFANWSQRNGPGNRIIPGRWNYEPVNRLQASSHIYDRDRLLGWEKTHQLTVTDEVFFQAAGALVSHLQQRTIAAKKP